MNSKRTAIKRAHLSLPMQVILEQFHPAGVFDYGCGRGDDVRFLNAKGIPALGYDPNFPSCGGICPAPVDTITCLYVVNVLEPHERKALYDSLLATLTLPDIKQMFIAARIDPVPGEPYSDGNQTIRGTFQKRYTAQSLLEEVQAAMPECVVEIITCSTGLVRIMKGND